MTNITEIEEAVRRLPPADMTQFRQWFTDFDAAIWDEQLQQDMAAGRLDALAAEALADLRAGRCTDL